MHWIKFYPKDWLAEHSLKACSLAARGLWMEMLCLMSDNEERGFLKYDADALAMVVGKGADEIKLLLYELEQAHVFSRDEHGRIFSRRMVRDHGRLQASRKFGKRGGNPALLYNLHPAPPHDSEDDRSKMLDTTVALTPTDNHTLNPLFLDHDFYVAWSQFVEHRRDMKKPLSSKAAGLILKDCKKWGAKVATCALEESIKNGWQGVFEPKKHTSKMERSGQRPGEYKEEIIINELN